MVSRESIGEVRGQKRCQPDSSDGAFDLPPSNEAVQGADSLKAWGYMPGHVHWKVGAAEVVSVLAACVPALILMEIRTLHGQKRLQNPQESMLLNRFCMLFRRDR